MAQLVVWVGFSSLRRNFASPLPFILGAGVLLPISSRIPGSEYTCEENTKKGRKGAYASRQRSVQRLLHSTRILVGFVVAFLKSLHP